MLKKPNQSIALLIGAGFSAPMGYPIGNRLNELMLDCDDSTFGISPAGTIMFSTDGSKPWIGYKTSGDISLEFLKILMKYYNDKIAKFDYEEFYDYLKIDARKDNVAKELSIKFVSEYWDYDQLIASLDNIYVQLVSYYLKDYAGNSWYDGEPYLIGNYMPGYTGFLSCMEGWLKEGVVNVHTLNHDLFFERLNYTDAIHGQLCDGFEELSSPYFGKISKDNSTYRVRLERFTDKYDTDCRLYKLHGSKDYGVYYGMDKGLASPEKYLKTRKHVSMMELFKERTNDKGVIEYEHCWINYHADFLTGTTKKIERYNEPLLYKILLGKFTENLKAADKLIIIGYGAKDERINQYMMENFDYKSKPVYIVDPYNGESVRKLKEILKGKHIEKHLEDIRSIDFEMPRASGFKMKANIEPIS